MAEPARKPEYDISPDIRPNLRVIDGGGETTPGRASLRAVDDQERNPQTPGSDASIGDQEKSPWVTKNLDKKTPSDFAGNKSKPGRKLSANNFKAIAKRRGLPSAIIVLVLGGGVAGVSFLGTLSLPVYIVDNLISKFDNRAVTDTVRTRLIVQDEISGEETADCVGVDSVVCDLEKPSNKLLSDMDEAGIKPLDGENKPMEIDSSKAYSEERPAAYEFTGGGSSGEKPIPASEFGTELDNNPSFRAAFHAADNPKFLGLSALDDVLTKIKTRFGFKTADELKDTANAKDAQTKINESVAGEDIGTGTGAVAGDAEKAIDAEITKTATAEADKIAKDGKGNAVGILAGIACGLGDAPGLMIATARAYQMTQVIKYSVIYITLFEAIKAGDANSTEVSAALGAFTATVAGKSAMDSFGMRFGLFGDTNTKSSKTFTKFIPGISAISALGGTAKVTDSAAKKDTCSVLTNPATGAVIDGATSETLVGPLINVGLGVALSVAVPLVAQPLIDTAVKTLPIGQMLQYFVGDLTKNIGAGEDVGDAFMSGLTNMLGQLANGSGNQAQSVVQATKFHKTADAVNLAYAQEDRATMSPLDPSSPNTMVGSMISNLLPYYSQLGTLTGVLSSVGSVMSGSLGSLFQGSITNAADDSVQYTLCPDPSVSGDAAGPFCSLDYGMTNLTKDPKLVASDMVSMGAVDSSTGEPIPDPVDPLSAVVPKSADGSTPGTTTSYADWLDLCTDGTTAQADNCKPTNDQTIDYALYTTDHPMVKDMNGVSSSSTSASTTTSAFNDTTSSYDQLASILSAINDEAVSTPTTAVAKTISKTQSTGSNFAVNSIIADVTSIRRAEVGTV